MGFLSNCLSGGIVNQADQIQVTRYHHEMPAARPEREQQFPIWHKRNCRRDDLPHNALRENSSRAGVMSLVPDITGTLPVQGFQRVSTRKSESPAKVFPGRSGTRPTAFASPLTQQQTGDTPGAGRRGGTGTGQLADPAAEPAWCRG